MPMKKEADILVEVEGLSKKFCKDLKKSLWYGVKDLMSNIGGNTKDRVLRKEEFWAVKDISFQLRRGECLGLIGHNGAGKSTLLKIINGLINPDAGKVTIRGKVGALIELGAGFNGILSGRENIYNNGAVLGFTRRKIEEKIEAIIDFSEIREFIDMPVQNYSSGMKVRLGFAIAAKMEPDVLLIDEVLAVGDLGFVLKCFKTIDTLLPKTAIVFVSHSMPMVSSICNKIILLERGEAVYNGKDIPKAIDKYYKRFTSNQQNIIFDDGSLEFVKAELIDAHNGNIISEINWNDDLKIYFKFAIKQLKDIPLFNIVIFDKEQRPVAILERNSTISKLNVSQSQIDFFVTHKNAQLSKGVYSISISVSKVDTKEPLLRVNDILSFQVIHEEENWQSFLLKATYDNY